MKLRVEEILQDQTFNRPHSSELANWINGLPQATRKRMVGVGLLAAAPTAMTVEKLIETFLASADVKPATRAAYRQTTQSLIKSLGSTKSVAQLTSADADTWRASCVAEGLAKATIAKRTNVAKTIFKKAVKLGIIKESPFEDLKVGSQVNSERSFLVSREVIVEVLEQCPNIQWRAIVGLTRYAGLRCPSELQQLKWSDVDWAKKQLTVRSPKTAHHAGHAERMVPVSEELQPILFKLFEMATEGDVLLFPKLVGSSGNLRTTFHKIIERAGHKPWPRLFQNLRGSCETDWADDYPLHQVASWLGHSPSIAARHYLKHKDLNFQAATGTGDWIQHKGIKKPAGASKKVSKISGAESGAFEVQNAVQHQAAPLCTFSQFGTQPLAPYDVVHGLATVCKTLQSETMGEEGFEPSKA
jgi:integrase